jgi:hypothetical protein
VRNRIGAVSVGGVVLLGVRLAVAFVAGCVIVAVGVGGVVVVIGCVGFVVGVVVVGVVRVVVGSARGTARRE